MNKMILFPAFIAECLCILAHMAPRMKQKEHNVIVFTFLSIM